MPGRGPSFLPSWAAGGPPSSNSPSPAPGRFLPPWVGAASTVRPVPASLLLRGGLCALPGEGLLRLDLLVEEGRIAALGKSLDGAGREILDVSGRWILPGLVDPHVHLGIFGPLAEEVHTETRSALLNGVTTIGLYAGGPEPYLKTLDATLELLREKSHVDVFLHLPIFTRSQLEELPLYASRYGITSFKVYLCGIPGLIPAADDAFLLDVMEAVAALGDGAVLNIHAENAALVQRAADRGLAASPRGLDPASWATHRPAYVEEEALRRAEYLSRSTGVRLYFVHLSAAAGVETLRRMKAEGRRVLAETTSPYLTLEPGSGGDSRTLMVPPLRGGADREALWWGVEDGTIDAIGTDHTPLTAAQKRLDAPAPTATPGYPAVGTHLASLFDETLRRGLSPELLVSRACRGPSRIFGVYPRKGCLLPGADADLVVVDPHRRAVATPDLAASRSDFVLHEGEPLRGWPDLVVKGGIVVRRDGPLPRGEYLARR